MAEVFEIIQKLSLEVTGNDTLKAQTDAFRKQGEAIDELSKKRDLLNRNIAKDPIPERAEKAKKAVAELTTKIDAQTAALTKQVQQSGIIQKAAQQEIGIIERLKNTINDLNRVRDRETSTSSIKDINEQIAKAKEELQALLKPEKKEGGSSILTTLFGDSFKDEAFGAFKGLLQGVGIGTGLSIIPALVSTLTDLAVAESDIVSKNAQLVAANEQLSDSFSSLGDSLDELDNLSKVISVLGQDFSRNPRNEAVVFGQSTEGLKRDVEALKAKGVVQGEIFDAEKAQYEATQKLRRDELVGLKERQETLQSTYEIVKSLSSQSVQAGSLFTDIAATFQRSDTRTGSNNAERDAVIARLRASGLPFDLQSNLIAAAKKAQEDGASIYDALISAAKKYTSQIIDAKQAVADKSAEIDNAEQERISKYNAEIYELNRSLQARINDNKLNALKESVTYQSQYDDDVNALINLNAKERDAALNKIDLERREFIKKNGEAALDVETEVIVNGKKKLVTARQEFNAIELASTQEFVTKEAQILDQANNRRIAAEKIAQNVLLQVQQQAAANRVETANDSGLPDIEATIKLQDAIAAQQTNALREQRTKELDEARKAHVDTTNLQIEFGRAEEELQNKQNRDKLDAQIKVYNDRLNLAKQASSNALLQLLADPTAQGNNAQSFLNGNQSAGYFRRRSIRANFEDAQKRQELEAKELQKQLALAEKNKIKIENNPESTTADVDAAIAKINSAKAELQKLTVETANTVANEQTRQIINAINLYGSLANSAVDAYNTINAAREKDLQREISVREQRVTVALKLAERGNTEVLALEQERLKAVQQERRKDALEQQAVNAALTISNSVVAVAKAAAEGGAFAFATIAATVAALVAGYATVTSLTQSQQSGFAEGGYTGDGAKYDVAGNVHKGEFVFDKETTARYRPVFEAIHKGEGIPMLARAGRLPANDNYASRQELGELKNAVYSVVDAVNSKQVKAVQYMDKNGLSQSITEFQAAQRRKYAN